MENNQDHIVKLFRDGLEGHELTVSEGVWAGVQSSLSAQTASVAVAGTGMMKAAAVVGISTVVAIGSFNEVRLANQSHSVSEETHVVMDNLEESATGLDQQTVNATEWSNTDNQSNENVDVKKVESISTTVENGSTEAEFAHSDQTENAVEAENLVADAAQLDKEKSTERDMALGQSENEENEVQAEKKVEVDSDEATEFPKEDVQERTEDDKLSLVNEENADTEEATCSIKMTHDAKAFISADGDGTNDCFEIKGGEGVVSFQISIWTRAGDLLFESTDPNFKWCGTDRFGNKVDNHTVCYYQINAVDEKGLQYMARNARGSVTVFR